MKLIIDTSNKDLCINLGAEVGPLLAALDQACIVTSQYNSAKSQYVYAKATNNDGTPCRIEMKLLDDAEFEEPRPAIEKMAEALKQSDNRWIEYYQRAQKYETELKELKAKLASLQPAAS